MTTKLAACRTRPVVVPHPATLWPRTTVKRDAPLVLLNAVGCGLGPSTPSARSYVTSGTAWRTVFPPPDARRGRRRLYSDAPVAREEPPIKAHSRARHRLPPSADSTL